MLPAAGVVGDRGEVAMTLHEMLAASLADTGRRHRVSAMLTTTRRPTARSFSMLKRYNLQQGRPMTEGLETLRVQLAAKARSTLRLVEDVAP
jgi:hypothetical protein